MKISRNTLFFWFLMLILLFYSAPLFSADKATFSLSTPRIFGPEDSEIYVNLSSKNVRYVDIKIYKLKDPLRFILNSKYKENLRTYKFSYNLDVKEKILNEAWNILNNLQYCIRRGLRKVLPYEVRAKIKDMLGIENFEEFSVPEPPLNVRVNRFLRDEEVLYFFREHIPRPKKKEWWSYRRILLPIKERGTYLVEASYNGKVAYTILIVNRISIAVKIASLSHKLLVFLEDKYTSSPLKNGTVYIVRKDKILAKGKTNEKGIYLLDNIKFSPRNVSVIVSYKDDITISRLPYFYYENPEINIYAYTDRPIYKPGHTVYFKSIIRFNDICDYILPPVGEKVKVSLRDPDYNIIWEKEMPIDEFGAISGKFSLSEDAALGFYTVSIKFKGTMGSTYFQVEEYEKPEFSLEASSIKKIYKKGEEIAIKVKATYYFGEPLRDGKIRYEVFAYPIDALYYEEKGGGEIFVKQGKGIFDDSGEFYIHLTPKDLEKLPNSTIYINIYATDWKNKLITSNYRIDYRATEFLLDIESDRYIYSKGEKVELKVKAFDIEKTPVDTSATIIVKHVIWKGNKRIRKIEKIDNIDILRGEYIYQFIPQSTGSYIIEAEARDKDNNIIKAYTYIWVSGRDIVYGSDRIKFITDKDKYKQGETIHAILLLPKRGITGLYTLEGRDLYEYKVIHATNNVVNIDIPLSKTYIGPVRIRFLFFNKGKYYDSYESIDIENIERKLTVEIVPDKETYKPGEEGEILVKVKDANGNGVKAEVSLGIVDEAIYALVYDYEDNIYDYFYTYASNYYDVNTSVSYYFNFYGSSFDEAIMDVQKKREESPLAEFKGEAGAPGGRGGVPPHVRRFFPDTLYFNPTIVTDEDGIAKVKVVFPDSLTSFRLTAKAITKDTKVGQARKNIYVKKDLFSRMSIPPFGVVGDELYISGIVHNYTKKTKELKVKIKTSPQIKIEENTSVKEVIVEPGRENFAPFKVKLTSSGKAITRIDIGTNQVVYDALQKGFKVFPYGYHITKALSGVLKGNKKEFGINFPKDIKQSTLNAKLEIDTSVISTLLPSFKYLIGYPYGCTEQTMSRLLPDIAVKRLIQLYNITSEEFGNLDDMILKGIRRLYRYQHDDGGWGWWEFDDSSISQTAYVLFGLSLLKEGGYLISPIALDRGFRYLYRAIEKKEDFSELKPVDKAFAIYALTLWKEATQKEKATIKEIATQFFREILLDKDIPPITFSYILLALNNLDEEEILPQVLYELKQRMKTSGNQVYWEGYIKKYYYITDVETTGWIGFAISKVYPNEAILENISNYLLTVREGDRWINTKSTAIVLLYLADYFKKEKNMGDKWTFTVYIGNRKVGKFSGEKYTTISIPLDREELLNERRIKIEKEKGKTLYYRVYLDYWRDEMPHRSEIGINVKYYRAIPHFVDEKYIFSKELIQDAFKLNSIVVAEIHINPKKPLYDVIIEVPRPAGFEYIKDDWKYEFAEEKEEKSYWYIFKEYRLDRVVFFINYIPVGGINIKYMARPREKGKFHVLPPKLTLMYNPYIEGFGEKTKIRIK